MSNCIVKHCKKSSDTTVGWHFFKIPSKEKNLEGLKSWLKILDREDLLEKNYSVRCSKVCADHFAPEDIKKRKKWTLKNGALPLPPIKPANCSQSQNTAISTPYTIKPAQDTSGSNRPLEENQTFIITEISNEDTISIPEQQQPIETIDYSPERHNFFNENTTFSSSDLKEDLLDDYLDENESFEWIEVPENDDPITSNRFQAMELVECPGKCNNCPCVFLKRKIVALESERKFCLKKIKQDGKRLRRYELEKRLVRKKINTQHVAIRRLKLKVSQLQQENKTKPKRKTTDKQLFMRLCRKFMNPGLVDFVREQMRQSESFSTSNSNEMELEN